jgi:FSR family fosmidomycin resistance protein-like MFS transporter
MPDKLIGHYPRTHLNTILGYAQDLVLGRIGAVSGFLFGFAFGLSGIGSALLGKLADITIINFVY